MTTAAISTVPLLSGFADPVFDNQAVFRGLMSAIAYPGRLIALDRSVGVPQPLMAATAALCLTLADFETPLWLDVRCATDDVTRYLRFHCGTRLVQEMASARFAVVADPAAMPRLANFCQGDVERPDRSTTLVVQVPCLSSGGETVWTGPGIKERLTVGVAGLPDWFWADWDLQREIYPLGVDVFFACGNAVVGLPRTVTVEV